MVTSQPKIGDYGPSEVIESITWHDGSGDTSNTLYQAAGGSDIWANTWAADGSLLLAWGDGAGFGPSPTDQNPQKGTQAGPDRAGFGFSRIVTNDPSQLKPSPADPYDEPDLSDPAVPHNLWGGIHAPYEATLGGRGNEGKVGGLLSVEGTYYAWMNLQQLEGGGAWPNVHQGLLYSVETPTSPLGKTWQRADVRFDKGPGNFKPSTFVQYGKDYKEGLDSALDNDDVYFVGRRQGNNALFYMGRAPKDELREITSYTYFAGLNSSGEAITTRAWAAIF